MQNAVVQGQINQQPPKVAQAQPIAGSASSGVLPQNISAVYPPQGGVSTAQPVQTYAQQPIQQPIQQPTPQQSVQVPNYSGVNIQIFNPSVGTPGAAPTYNVNAPTYGPSNPSCYPSNYYTQPLAQVSSDATNKTITDTNKETTTKKDEKKTEKRQIVQLTDDYIKNLENYLNSQDKEIRLMGAKEVVARLQEDDKRKDDKALNALVNKMLQDPSQQIKILALSVLDGRLATGDDFTVQVLKNMQSGKSGYGQDALQASNILLKMSGQTIEKEFEVKDKPKKQDENPKV